MSSQETVDSRAGEGSGEMGSDEVQDPAISDEEVSALLEPSSGGAVQPYEFPLERTRHTELPMLELIAKTFAERASVTLTALLGREAQLHFEALQTVRQADLLAALPVPVSLPVVRLKPLPGLGALRLDPPALLAMLDGFFGGSGQPSPDAQAAVAPAAQRFLALLVRSLAPDFGAAWAPVSPLELELVKQEQNPRLLTLGEAKDPVLAVRFTVEFGSPLGRLEWLLPESMLAPVRELLAAEGGARSASPAPKHEPWAPRIAQSMQGAQLELRAVLSEVEISLGRLVRLMPGDIIPIEAPSEATLLVGDVALWRGRFGVSQGHNALKIIPGGSSR